MKKHYTLHHVATIIVLMYATSVLVNAQVSYDSIVYSRGTFFGTATNDSYLLHVAVDAQGYVYGTGLCRSIPATPGAYQTSLQGGGYDAMVFKLDPTMKNLIWATYIGGSNIEAGGGIAVNAAGEVCLTGYTLSPNFPVTVAADQAYLSNGAVCYFALKLSADGSSLIYSRILGRGSNITQQTQSASKGAHITLSPSGDAFVFSHTNSTTYQITAGAYQSTLAGSSDFVLTKLNPAGTIVSSTFFGGSAAETSYDICYANNKVYCSGSTSSALLPLRAGKVPDASDCVVFVADDGATVSPRRAFVYGSIASDVGYSVSFDSHANRICLTGVSGSGMPGSVLLQAGQGSGGFVATIDTALTGLIYTTMIGTGVVPTSVAARTSNSTVYVAGYVTGSLPVSANAFQGTNQGGLDGLMVSVDSAGSALKYGTFMGGSNSDYSAAKVLLVDRGCLLRVIFGITTHSVNFPSTNNTYQPQKLNGVDDQPALAMFSTLPTANIAVFGKPCSKEYTFTLTSSCPYTNLVWNFGDGSANVLGTNPVTHVFPAFANYKVTATALTQEGDSLIKKIDVGIGNGQAVDAGPDQTVCKKNPLTQLNASGAQIYRWSPGKAVSDSTIPNPTTAPTKTTMYYVWGKDSFGCESIDSVLIIVREITAKVEKDTAVCEGASVMLKASGGVYYAWQPTNGLSSASGAVVIAAPQTETSYSVIAFDGVCFDTARVTIKLHPRPRLKMAPVPSICANTPVELGVVVTIPGSSDSDVVSYRWTPTVNINDPKIPNPIVTLSKDAWYKVTVTTKHGCVMTDSVHITMQNKLRIAVTADTAVCTGTKVQLKANGAAEYAWSPGIGLSDSTIANPVCTTPTTRTYRVIGKSGACIDTQFVTVTVFPMPAGIKARGDTTVCINDRVHLWIENADSTNLQYSWYPAKDFENPSGHSVYLHASTPQTYTVMVRNAQGCMVVDSVRVRVDNALNVVAGPSVSACDGETAVLKITSNNDASTNFTWTPNDGVWNPTTKEYTITVRKDQVYRVHGQRGSCSGDAQFNVSVKPQPVFTLSNDTALCYGSTVTLSARSSQNGIAYRWLNGTVPDTSLDNPLSDTPTTHPLTKDLHLTVEANLDGCIRTKDITVRVLDMPSLVGPPDTLICAGESMQFHIETSAVQAVTWEPAEGLSSTTTDDPIASPTKNTRYTVTVVSFDGCVRSTSVNIGVKPRVGIRLGVLPINNAQVLSPGDTTSIYIAVRGDSSIQSPLSFDVVLNSNIFEQTSFPYNDIGSRRHIHIVIPSYIFKTTDTTIIRIPGKALQAAPSFSDVSIDNVVIDSSRCPNLSRTPSVISITSCFSAGRNVNLFQPLALSVHPHPISDDGVLAIGTSDRGSCSIQIMNALGQEVAQWNTQITNDESVVPLSLRQLGSGVFTVIVRTAEQHAALRLIKQ